MDARVHRGSTASKAHDRAPSRHGGPARPPARALGRLSAERAAAPLDSAIRTERAHLLVFDDPHGAVHAARRLRELGFNVTDVHSPFPLHGVDEALGLPETRLPWATFAGGAIGCAIAFAFQAWVHTRDFPLNIGGKSNLALPAMIPVGFELTVLLASFATVFGLLFRERLFGPRSATPEHYPDPRISDDRFVVVVSEDSASFSLEQLRAACAELSPVEVVESWRVR